MILLSDCDASGGGFELSNKSGNGGCIKFGISNDSCLCCGRNRDR